MATLSEAISAVQKQGKLHGFQVLDQCLVSATAKKKPTPHTEVKFATDSFTASDAMQLSLGNEPEKVGLIVWVDREAFREQTEK